MRPIGFMPGRMGFLTKGLKEWENMAASKINHKKACAQEGTSFAHDAHTGELFSLLYFVISLWQVW